MQSQSLYGLTAAYSMLATAEDAPEFEAALAQLQDAIEVKADGIGRVIRMYEAGSNAIQAEIDRLADLKAYRDRRVKSLKEYLLDNMVRADMAKLDTALFRLAVRQNPPAVTVADGAVLPDAFMRVIPEHREVDRRAILDHVKNGGEAPEGAVVTRGRRLELK